MSLEGKSITEGNENFLRTMEIFYNLLRERQIANCDFSEMEEKFPKEELIQLYEENKEYFFKEQVEYINSFINEYEKEEFWKSSEKWRNYRIMLHSLHLLRNSRMLQQNTHIESRIKLIKYLLNVTNDVLWFNMGGINDIYILAKYLNNLPKNYKDHSEEFAEILENSIKNSNYKMNILLTIGKPDDDRLQIIKAWNNNVELKKRVPLFRVIMDYKDRIEKQDGSEKPHCKIFKMSLRLHNHFALGSSRFNVKEKEYYNGNLAIEMLHHETPLNEDIPRMLLSIKEGYCISLELKAFYIQLKNYSGNIEEQ